MQCINYLEKTLTDVFAEIFRGVRVGILEKWAEIYKLFLAPFFTILACFFGEHLTCFSTSWRNNASDTKVLKILTCGEAVQKEKNET